MKNIILGLVSILLFLSACSLIAPATPSTSQLEATVYQQLTALPSHLPPTSIPPTIFPTISVNVPNSTTGVVPPTAVPLTPFPPASTAVPTLVPYPTAVIQSPAVVPVYSPLYPDQFIYYYFANINQRNYSLTWSLLTDSFKYANNGADQGGYLGYANFWDGFKRVDIFSVTITSQGGNNAVVKVNMQYTNQNGAVVTNLQIFNLVFDPSRSTWLFNSFTPITTPTSLPPITQTPEQFILSYFASINTGNFTLTWSLLTDSFKAKANNGSYTDYTNFWTSVSHVDVNSVSLSSLVGGIAVVNVNMVFNYRSGLVTPSIEVFHLVYDWSRATWLFDSTH